MEILETVIHYIRTQLAPANSTIEKDTNLFCDGHLDSTAMLEVILWLGDTFNITIQNEELTPENFSTPRKMAEFVQSKSQAEIASD